MINLYLIKYISFYDKLIYFALLTMFVLFITFYYLHEKTENALKNKIML